MKGTKKHVLLGVSSSIILSKEIFPKNDDLKIFLKETYNLEFRDYVFKSRTLIVARVIRHINKLESNDTEKLRKSLLLFIDKLLNINASKNTSKSDIRLSNWIRGIKDDGISRNRK